jgi:DNA-binding transcriptional ArsR family regulator
VRNVNHPPLEEVPLADVLHAFSDPVRLEIVRALKRRGEQCCGELETTVSKSTLSHHLKVLRQAGVTWTRVDGTQRFVSLRTADLDDRFPGLLETVVDCAGQAR